MDVDLGKNVGMRMYTRMKGIDLDLPLELMVSPGIRKLYYGGR
jgi:hypothetical protein